MKLELKAIKHSEFASQETHCYQANLYLDGKKVATVGNDGHGGCDYQDFESREVKDKVENYFLQNPIENFNYNDYPLAHLEIWCCKEVNKFLCKKDFKNTMKKICYTDGKDLYVVPPRVKPTEENFARLKKASWWKDSYTILNTLPEAEALNLYRTL